MCLYRTVSSFSLSIFVIINTISYFDAFIVYFKILFFLLVIYIITSIPTQNMLMRCINIDYRINYYYYYDCKNVEPRRGERVLGTIVKLLSNWRHIQAPLLLKLKILITVSLIFDMLYYIIYLHK